MFVKTIKNFGRPSVFVFGLTGILSFGALMVLILTGTLQYGGKVAEYIGWERSHIARELESRLGDLARETQALAQTLSLNIEKQLQFLNLSMADLSSRPDALEWIAAEELDLVLPALDKTRAAGAFVAFEATVNPQSERAEYSRAGLYIRNSEPVIPGSSYKQLLKGFTSLAGRKNLILLSGWDLEFDMRGKDCYNTPVATWKQDPALPLSRSCYWSFMDPVSYDGGEDPSLFCSVPIVSSRGELLGVCGFEVSPVTFRLIHNPGADPYPRLLCVFAPLKGDRLDGEGGFRSGNLASPGPLENFVFMDALEPVKLYGAASPYGDRKMALALGMPRQDYHRRLLYSNGVLLLLPGLGILGGALFLRGHYKRAYAKKLEARLVKAPPDFKPYGLSRREEEICLLLLKGHTIREISVQLYIAFATANNHCQNIYRKLDINSRQELFLKFGA